jgi:hypothetical protein
MKMLLIFMLASLTDPIRAVLALTAGLLAPRWWIAATLGGLAGAATLLLVSRHPLPITPVLAGVVWASVAYVIKRVVRSAPLKA